MSILRKFKICAFDNRTGTWDEQIIEANGIEDAESEARGWWFDINEPAYTAEEVEN